MEVDALRGFFGWCTVINYIVLLFWWGFISFAGDWMYALHGKWFGLSRTTFNAAHYAGMALLKLVILAFNLTPYLVLSLFF